MNDECRKRAAGTVLLIMLLLVGCSQSGHDGKVEQVGEDARDVHLAEVHWTYSGEEGPDHWGKLSPDFAPCSEGLEQSPIDLTNATTVDGGAFERRIGETALTIEQRARVMNLVDNGHTIQVTNDVPMALDLDGKHYELVQYHFHAPSEHTINGEFAPLEVHFVHKSAAGELAVIGVLVEEGEHDPIWDPVLAALPTHDGESRHIEDLELDMSELRPLPKRYYRYHGSLTTPPCSEGVEWFVMAEKRQISPEQMATLVPLLDNNNRPVQPLGERELVLVSVE
ncbi:MAG: carbonic anhydrase family protein [bacterium]|nr:carbonic anhydrase family protein [bacterium]